MKDRSTPAETLISFLGEMKMWEQSFFKQKMQFINEGKPTTECNEKYNESLKHIFIRYSTNEKDNWARLGAPSCGDPTMYDPERDQLQATEFKGSEANITLVQAVGTKATFKFTLTKEDRTWKIKKKQTFRAGRWNSSAL